MLSNPRHAIINAPQLQIEVLLWDVQPYIVKSVNSEKNFNYIVGKDEINCVSFPDSQIRLVGESDMINLLCEELNRKFPVDTTT